jgi:leader peptidase (prepilin peptidase)/N-methyltransferase
MLTWIALLCIISALALLLALAIVDLRTRLLPNEMVLGFATLGIVFHLTTMTAYLSITEISLGSIIGFGVLYVIRGIANYFYKTDTLGLGDVKLLAAGGIWLGPDMIMPALMIGAVAALAHGALYALWQGIVHKRRVDFARLQLPAGPGFAIGIVAAGGWAYRAFFAGLMAGHI